MEISLPRPHDLGNFDFLQSIFRVDRGPESVGLEMYVVEDKGGAIALMLAALFFLGTWPAILTLLEQRGRLPQHTYLDYSITNLLAAILIALTFGQIGDSTPTMPNFLTQLTQVTNHFHSLNIFSIITLVLSLCRITGHQFCLQWLVVSFYPWAI